MILRLPQITSGRPENAVDNSAPAMVGLIAAARLRGTAVTLAAAGRSAGGTRALTEDVRVGTSICDSAARIKSSVSTAVKSGTSAARIRQMLDGMWVKTIVL